MSGCEPRRKKRIKNIVNRYPICNKDLATFEKLEASHEETLIQLANAVFQVEQLNATECLERYIFHLNDLTELSDENHVETEKRLHEVAGTDVKDTQIPDDFQRLKLIHVKVWTNIINQFRELVRQPQIYVLFLT
ncbi:hypothetical protein BYT27DRAFT_7339899 [Phlegmacium glaucopus]|nr:hypothetical protein BYT27DRAFT_7339899 [Phlegmacium glaucopus]